MSRKTGFMNFKLFTDVIDEMEQLGIKRVTLHFYGEPLLHPKIIEMIIYAKEHSLITHIDTNAILLTEEMSRKIIESDLDSIQFSFHAFTQEQYKETYGVNSFNTVIYNIKKFYELKLENKKKSPKVIISSTITDINYLDYHKIQNIFNKCYDKLDITNCYYNKQTTNDHRLIKFNYHRKSPCISLYKVLAVSWDGTITVCCMDHEFKLNIGNIYNGIKVLFNSGKINTYRRWHFKGEYKKMPLCSTCMFGNDANTYISSILQKKIIDGKIHELS
jgi:radical SAM protein with 4Fe4S-binding SPASM domain